MIADPVAPSDRLLFIDLERGVAVKTLLRYPKPLSCYCCAGRKQDLLLRQEEVIHLRMNKMVRYIDTGLHYQEIDKCFKLSSTELIFGCDYWTIC